MKNVKIILKNHKSLLANANICVETQLYGSVNIKGFQIWKSNVFNDRLQEAINIAPPSLPNKGSYVQLVFFNDRKLWFELERIIYSAYLESIRKKDVLNEDVDPNDIPDSL